jgi:hypothetical protein
LAHIVPIYITDSSNDKSYGAVASVKMNFHTQICACGSKFAGFRRGGRIENENNNPDVK